MTIRADSYGSVEAVAALTRHLLDGAPMFNESTRPTLTEVEGFIDRWSAVLNVALLSNGTAAPVAHEMIKLTADQFVIRQAAAEVELTHRGAGWGDTENTRARALMMTDANATAAAIGAALQEVDATGAPGKASDGLSYTGFPATYDRYAIDAGYERATFRRGQFDA